MRDDHNISNDDARHVEVRERILRDFNELMNLINKDQFRFWADMDITMTQMKVLIWIHSHGPAKVGSLAEALGVHVSTMTGILDRLVDRGLVQREEGRDDRRLVVCSLTPQGRELIARTSVAWGTARFGEVLAGMDYDSLRQFANGQAALIETWSRFAADRAKKPED